MSVQMEDRGNRILVVAHVYYPELWKELAGCLRVIREPHDLVVTYVDEESVREARSNFPSARFIRCENRGYDVWPFLRALQETGLDGYGVVVKLHTKRDVGKELLMNHTWLSDFHWRRHLLSFLGSPRAWAKALARLKSDGIGLVADRHVVFDREEAGPAYVSSFDRAKREVEELAGGPFPSEGLYVGGTMFAARTAPLRLLLRRGFTADMFEESAGHDRETYAHVVERMLGLCVFAAGLRIVAWNGSLRWRRLYYSKTPLGRLLRFIYQSRIRDWRLTVKVFGITVLTRT